MKTLTEFPGLNIRNAAQTKVNLLAEGKTPEELGPALGEALKLEGERLGFLLNALDVVQTRLEDLKRVVVYSLSEGEKAPQGAVQKGDHTYLAEYFPSLAKNNARPSKPGDNRSPRNRGKKRGSKRGDRNSPHGKRPVKVTE